MKVHKIICPKCQSSLTSKSGIDEGTAINCPKCRNKFAVAAPAEDDEVVEDFEVVEDEDEAESPKKPAAKSALKPLSKQRPADEDDEEEEAPKKTAAKSELKPLAKQKPVVVEDDED